MEWNNYRDGYLAKSKYGHLFIDVRFGANTFNKSWFIFYEPGDQPSANAGFFILSPLGYESLDEAKRAATRYAEMDDSAYEDEFGEWRADS